jgi:hypothetical protein
MANHAKARASSRPRRKAVHRSRARESLLLRSAKSLGRAIGALQRQLEQTRETMTPRARRASSRGKKRTGGKK